MYRALCPNTKIPNARYAAFRSLRDPTDAHKILDSGALVLRFPHPHTATGEDVLELHVHGGPAVVKAILAAVGRCASPTLPIRYAEPGEFTRRAFLNDRMDLTQIESLGDTLSAVTEEQRRLSVRGTTSGLAERYEEWRTLLLYARGELEALIDFSEDQHFDESPSDLAASVADQAEALLKNIRMHSQNAVRGELLRSGIAISLLGSPNAGKSSLLNQIVGRNAAIVSHEAGTTRDVIEVGIDIGGFFCRLGDTAGIRGESALLTTSTKDAIGDIEREGIARAKEKALQCDLVILVLSVERALEGQGYCLRLDGDVVETAQQLLQSDKRMVVCVNKMDHFGGQQQAMSAQLVSSVQQVLPSISSGDIHCISCAPASAAPRPNADGGELDAKDPGQVQAFLLGLIRTFRAMTRAVAPTSDHSTAEGDASLWHEALGATERQRLLLDQCAHHLEAFVRAARHDVTRLGGSESTDGELDIVTASESLRAAARCLGQMTGRGEAGDVESVLGVVFEK